MRLGIRLLWLLCLGGLTSLSATAALAAPITYNLDSGFAVVSAVRAGVGTTILAPVNLNLMSATIEFDPMTGQIFDFSLSIAPSGTLTVANPYGPYEEFSIDSAMVEADLTFSTLSSIPTGVDSWQILAGPLDITATYSATDLDGIAPNINMLPVPFVNPSPLLSATVSGGMLIIEMQGLTLTDVDGAVFGETDDLNVKADVFFTAVIPEPSTGLLMMLGLVGFSLRRRGV